MSFHARLRNYYLKVAEVLRGDADAASIFPNNSDIGVARERIYADFLRQHAPSKCNVFLGGFLFHTDGTESKQLDVIVTTDTAPRYNLHNRDGEGKSFSPVEGTLGVASIKSRLDRVQLHHTLDGLASIPPTKSLSGRVPFNLVLNNYDDWPYKIIYASNGLTADTIIGHLYEYYAQNQHIPICRRPNIIHVAGKYVIFRVDAGKTICDRTTGFRMPLAEGSFHCFTVDSDLQAICTVLNELQQRATLSSQIMFKYTGLVDRLLEIEESKPLLQQ